MFDYRFEIAIDAGEELPYVERKGHPEGPDTYIYDSLYYGFTVKDEMKAHELDHRAFVLSGTSTLKDLKTMFTKLTHEILESETPTKHFKTANVLLQATLNKQFEEDYEDNATCTITRHYPVFGIQFDLHKLPAPVKKDPEPDGCVTGNLWRVTLKLNNKAAKSASIQYDEDIYCIKPESAVHEAIDRLLRLYNNVLDKYVLETPVQVRKITDAFKVPYVVVEEKE